MGLQDDDAGATRLPAVRIAAELGNKLAANIVLLGFLVGATELVSRDAIEEAIRKRVRQQHLELDLMALDAGIDFARRAGRD